MSKGDVYLDRTLDLTCPHAYNKLMLQMSEPNSNGEIAAFMLQKTAYTSAGTGFERRNSIYTIQARANGFRFPVDVIFFRDFAHLIDNNSLLQTAGRVVHTLPPSLIEEICRHALTSRHLSKYFRSLLALPV